MKKYQISLGEKKIIKDQGLLQFEEIKKQIQILPELEQLIPPLLAEEYQQLERNILQEGCREALLIWQTTTQILSENALDDSQIVYVLVDGHNRFNICSKHGIDFKIHLIDFKSIFDVRQYMIDNQLGRRNLSPEQMSYLRGMKYLTQKQERGKYERLEHKGQNVLYGDEALSIDEKERDLEHKGQNVLYGDDTLLKPEKEGPLEHKGQNVLYEQESVSTSEKLGQKFNVSEKTIKRDAEFAKGLEKLAPTLKADILSGKIKVKKGLIQNLAKKEDIASELTTVEKIEQILAKTSPPLSVTSSPKNTTREAMIKQLASLTLQLQKTGAIELCDEIIACASQIKKTSV
ncbi:hypothetical protein [Runella zeae]|uniref:hypothetical protein n=1 Tax=Runella zeae TaxID=94255 RepID=UPI0004250BA1|nr:hypothetical protein [Runella zeae]